MWRAEVRPPQAGSAPRLVVDDANAVRVADVAGIDLIRAPRLLVADDLDAGRVVSVPDEQLPPTMEISIVRRTQIYATARTALVSGFLPRRARRLK